MTRFLIGVLACVAGCVPLERPREVVKTDVRQPWIDPDRPVLRVGTRVLTRGEVYRRILERVGNNESIQAVAKEELLRQGAESLGVTVPEEDADRVAQEKFSAWCEEFEDAEAMRKELALEGLTRDDMLASCKAEARQELLVGSVVAQMRVIDDKALHDYYRETYAQSRVHVRHLAFPGQATEKDALQRRADEACARLRGGERWETVAREYLEGSEDEPAALGGDRGWIGDQADLPEELKKILFALGDGETSEPIWEEGFGYHVFSVTQKVSSQPFAQCRDQMARELRQQPPKARELQETLGKLREKFPVEVLDAAAAEATAAGAGRAAQ